MQMAYEVLSDEASRAEYDGYKSRSYYENQYGPQDEGQSEGAQGERFYKEGGEFDRESYK